MHINNLNTTRKFSFSLGMLQADTSAMQLCKRTNHRGEVTSCVTYCDCCQAKEMKINKRVMASDGVVY
jgi:hypothetical protein